MGHRGGTGQLRFAFALYLQRGPSMHYLAHHAGEETLAPLLVLGGAWLSLLAAYGRTRLTAARARLTRARRRP
jgi:hypothetical protein